MERRRVLGWTLVRDPPLRALRRREVAWSGYCSLVMRTMSRDLVVGWVRPFVRDRIYEVLSTEEAILLHLTQTSAMLHYISPIRTRHQHIKSESLDRAVLRFLRDRR